MKTYCRILLYPLLLIITGYACSDDNSDNPELIVSTEEIAFGTTGGTQAIHIKTNQRWSASSSESWCTITPSSGEGTGTTKLEIITTENSTNDNRTATITITAGSLSNQIKVTQAQKDLLVLTQDLYKVLANGETVTVEFQVTGQYKTNIKADWITEQQTKAVSDEKKTFIIAANTSFYSREGTIDFTLGNITETVTIIQEGKKLSIPTDKTGMDSDATTLGKQIKIGWNLGNSLEACTSTSASETLWGNPKTTKQLIDGVKAAGFNAVRIPCAWSGYITNQETYEIDAAWFSRVKEVVDYCTDNDMYAIINIHWDGGWRDENPVYSKQETINKKHKALWEQIAVYFRDYDEHLLFAGTNEVHDGYGTPTSENIDVQLSFNQVFVDAVRSTGGRNTWRNLIVQSFNTNIDYAVQYLKMPQDITANRIMTEVHYYDPWDFCGEESSNKFLWGKDFIGNANTSNWGQEDWADKTFNSMKVNFVDKGIPVILGEYGVILRTNLPEVSGQNHIKARNYYLNYITKSAIDNGLIPFYWDNGHTGNNGFGLFDRSNGNQVHTDAIEAIISATR